MRAREFSPIAAFFQFLKTIGPNVVLVGLDKDRVDILVQKLKAKDKVKFRSLVAGYTWWKRVLKHTNSKHKYETFKQLKVLIPINFPL